MTRTLRVFSTALFALLMLLGCIAPGQGALPSWFPGSPNQGDTDSSEDCPNPNRCEHQPIPQVGPTPAPARPAPAIPPRVEVAFSGVSMPLGLTWTPDGRKLFFSEVKQGQIRVAAAGQLQAEPFIKLPLAKGSETGMLGLAIDPEYGSNRFVYAYYSDPASERNVVLRFVDRDGRATDRAEIFRSVSISDNGGAHNGGRLAFGPDGKLYVSAGNGQNRKIGQDPCKLGGKIIRLNRDGSRPTDNPVDCSPVFALGFRNPFGLAFHPTSNLLFISDNGGEGHDELNLIRPGGNYGHSLVEGRAGDARFVDPLWETGSNRIGPTGLAFSSGDRLPEYRDDLFFCGVHNGQLTQVRLAAPGFDRIESMAANVLDDPRITFSSGLERGQTRCQLDVANGPDGALYFTDFSRIMRITR